MAESNVGRLNAKLSAQNSLKQKPSEYQNENKGSDQYSNNNQQPKTKRKTHHPAIYPILRVRVRVGANTEALRENVPKRKKRTQPKNQTAPKPTA